MDEESQQGNDNARKHRTGCIRTLSGLVNVLKADLYRYSGKTSLSAFLKNYAFTPGYKVTVLARLCGYLKLKPVMGFGLYPFFKWMSLRARYKYGITIPEYMLIAPGFFINRFGGIYFHGDAIIGANANITHGVVLGLMNRGERAGAPHLGARVFLGSGAKVIGGIRIGNDCSVGANAVVTKDVPDKGVVGGIPAKLLSSAGSEGYVNKQVPEALMRKCRDAFHGPVPEGFYDA